MNIFKIHRDYMNIGPEYGCPIWYVECGYGISYKDPIDVVKKMMCEEGLKKDDWVIIKRGLAEKGIGVLVKALKYINAKVEVECTTEDVAPAWMLEVDRWIVHGLPGSKFNCGALRPRQDMLIYSGNDILGFIGASSKVICLRGLIVEDKDKVWELVKYTDIRVYQVSKHS